jgi:dienelactone hydrolase
MLRSIQRQIRAVLICLVFIASAQANAQAPNATLDRANVFKDLIFPDTVSTFSFFRDVEMGIYKPEGTGPFPALVLLHQCGGLKEKSWQNKSMQQWAKTAVEHGYVAFLLDSFSQRGGINCQGNGTLSGMTHARGVRDAFQALAHLQKFDFIDKNRIALAGFSWGGGNTLLVSSKQVSDWLSPGLRFNAGVVLYPDCSASPPPAGVSYEKIRPDIDRPLLVLISDKDVETPPSECLPMLKAAKSEGAMVEWYQYTEETHCWDCKNLDGHTSTDWKGTKIRYTYSESGTKDSEKRMFDFLKLNLTPHGTETPLPN